MQRSSDGVGTIGETDGTGRVYRTTQDESGCESVSVAVVEAIATAKDVVPTEIEPPLYDVIDPDALDRLFGPTDPEDTGGEIRFEMADCEVTVRSNGDIVVRQLY